MTKRRHETQTRAYRDKMALEPLQAVAAAKEGNRMLPISEITLVGNLGHDPSTGYTKNGTMNVSFSVAVTKRGRGADGGDVTNWYRATAWGKLAETLDNLANEGTLLKGSQVLIMGDLTVREYTKRDGENGYALEVNARSVNIANNRERATSEDDNHTY